MKLTNSLILISITLMLFGVKKWDNLTPIDFDYTTNDTYFLKAKVNGNWVEFNQENELTASFGPFIDNVYDGTINASSLEQVNQSAIASIGIVIRKKGEIGIGSYSGGQYFEYGFKGVLISYTDGPNMMIYTTDMNNPQSFIKITQLTDTHVKGTFSGEVFNIMTKDKISITDGEFSLKNTSY